MFSTISHLHSNARCCSGTASHLPEGGRLLVRVMDGRAGGVAILTRLCEQAAVKIGWNRAANVHWRPLTAVRADLLEADLGRPAIALAGQAIGNQLLIGEKRAALAKSVVS